MREIKFRAWIDNPKFEGEPRMFYQDTQYLGSFLRRANQVQFDSSGHDSYGRVNLMQYTGLKDKNGKEIYEGDICRLILRNRKEVFVEIVFYEKKLKFCKRRLGRNDKYSGLINPTNFDKPVNLAVIGNIYENPELKNSI